MLKANKPPLLSITVMKTISVIKPTCLSILSHGVLLAPEDWWPLSLDLEPTEAQVEEKVAVVVGGPMWAGFPSIHGLEP